MPSAQASVLSGQLQVVENCNNCHLSYLRQRQLSCLSRDAVSRTYAVGEPEEMEQWFFSEHAVGEAEEMYQCCAHGPGSTTREQMLSEKLERWKHGSIRQGVLHGNCPNCLFCVLKMGAVLVTPK